MTLEDYLKLEHAEGKIEHVIRAQVSQSGSVAFYIHPANKDGRTVDFIVRGNELVTLSNIGG